MKPGGETLTFGPNYIYSGGGGGAPRHRVHAWASGRDREAGRSETETADRGEAGMSSRTERLVKERRDSMPSKRLGGVDNTGWQT